MSPVPAEKWHKKDESQLMLAFFLENIVSCGEGTAGREHCCNGEWRSVQAQLL